MVQLRGRVPFGSQQPNQRAVAQSKPGTHEVRKARRSFLFTKRLCVSLTFAILVAIVEKEYFVWIWKNRYLYTHCPENKLWTRRPDILTSGQRGEMQVRYISAKFGYSKDIFADQVLKHVEDVNSIGALEGSTMVRYTEFPDFILNDKRWDEHLAFRKKKGPLRGGGYWFWKAVIIQHNLRELNDGDILVYSDVDRLDWLSWIGLLIDTVVERDANLALEQMSYLERQYSKGDLYQALCPAVFARDISTDHSTQYNANFLLARKSPGVLQLLDEWVGAGANFSLISDNPSHVPNAEDFVESRHDQSILSLLLKCRFKEAGKKAFPWTCLGDWYLHTYHIEAQQH